jgi:hypothetical protein
MIKRNILFTEWICQNCSNKVVMKETSYPTACYSCGANNWTKKGVVTESTLEEYS